LEDTKPAGDLIEFAKTIDRAQAILTFIDAIAEKHSPPLSLLLPDVVVVKVLPLDCQLPLPWLMDTPTSS